MYYPYLDVHTNAQTTNYTRFKLSSTSMPLLDGSDADNWYLVYVGTNTTELSTISNTYLRYLQLTKTLSLADLLFISFCCHVFYLYVPPCHELY